MTDAEKKTVFKIRQSPLNALRWSVDLECGHELWVTSARKPKAKRMQCPQCRRPHD